MRHIKNMMFIPKKRGFIKIVKRIGVELLWMIKIRF
jgi:hypothetical protein